MTTKGFVHEIKFTPRKRTEITFHRSLYKAINLYLDQKFPGQGGKVTITFLDSGNSMKNSGMARFTVEFK